MARDYNKEIDFKTYYSIVQQAVKEELEVEELIGALNDSYIIYNWDKDFTFNNIKPRKYIILYTKIACSWSDSFHILFTDDQKKIKKFIENNK